MPVKITAKKYMGNDAASWAVFVNGRPVFTGLTRAEVPFYKGLASRMQPTSNKENAR